MTRGFVPLPAAGVSRASGPAEALGASRPRTPAGYFRQDEGAGLRVARARGRGRSRGGRAC